MKKLRSLPLCTEWVKVSVNLGLFPFEEAELNPAMQAFLTESFVMVEENDILKAFPTTLLNRRDRNTETTLELSERTEPSVLQIRELSH